MSGVRTRTRRNGVAGIALAVGSLSLVAAAGCGEDFKEGLSPATGAGDGGMASVAGSDGESGGATAAPSGAGEGGGADGGAGATAASGAAGTGGDPGVADTAPPTIVSVQPPKKALGVDANAAIEITFSEPMAKAQTQLAYQSGSAGIKPSEVMFSWNAAGTVLTVKPNAALAYAEGAQPGEVTPTAYDYFVSTAAEDQAGNSLAASYQVEFSTLRRIGQILPATSSLTGSYKVAENQEAPLPQMYVGCLEANEVFRSFVSFNLGLMPEGIVQFESASLEMFESYQSSTDRTPFEALGDLEVHSVDYVATNRAAFDALDASGLKPIGKFGTSAAVGYKSVLVTATLAADYKRRNASQYGIKFHTKLNLDGHHDIVYFEGTSTATPPRLLVSYLVP